MQSRCSDAMDDTTAVGYMQAVADTLAPVMGSNVSFNSVSVALSGSDVVNPVAGLDPVAGTGSAVGVTNQPRAISIPGRSSTGRKTKVFLYGTATDSLPLSDSWEQDPITDTVIQGFQALLVSQGDFWLAIDGVKPVWYFRLNIKFNDHFVAKARQ